MKKFLVFLLLLMAALFGLFWLLVKLAKSGSVLPPSASQKVLALAGSASSLIPTAAPDPASTESESTVGPAFGEVIGGVPFSGGTVGAALINMRLPDAWTPLPTRAVTA